MSEVDLAADSLPITARVIEACSSVTSAPVILGVNADTIPPSIGEVIALKGPHGRQCRVQREDQPRICRDTVELLHRPGHYDHRG